MNGQNLDQLCAQYGWAMCQVVGDAFTSKDGKPDKAKTENHITKSLGVLQEDGVYAFFLYQASRGQREKVGAEKLREQAHALLKQANIKPFDTQSDSLLAVRGDDKIQGLADNLDDLLLAKRLLEQALIYARYHAKALRDSSLRSE
jgi:hypothetical protein